MNELPLNQILRGDCVEVLKNFPENSVDLVVTDPPYGLSFMGKDWDKTLPPRAAFEEVIRVLKPGGLAFVMSSPRQDLLWRMLAMLEGVGFELTQSYIDWIYKTGFPKAYDVSKGIDKKLGETGDVVGEKLLWGHNAGSGAGSFSKNIFEGQVGIKRTEPIIAPSSDLAKKWDGWKSQTGLKPAHEPILMVNKSFSESTIVDNVLRWGTGAINVDAARIPFQGKADSDVVKEKHDSAAGIPRDGGNTYQWKDYKGKRTDGFTEKGRFPANLLVSDKALDLVGRQDEGRGHTPKRGDTGGLYEGGLGIIDREERHFKDSGGPSRYFDLDSWHSKLCNEDETWNDLQDYRAVFLSLIDTTSDGSISYTYSLPQALPIHRNRHKLSSPWAKKLSDVLHDQLPEFYYDTILSHDTFCKVLDHDVPYILRIFYSTPYQFFHSSFGRDLQPSEVLGVLSQLKPPSSQDDYQCHRRLYDGLLHHFSELSPVFQRLLVDALEYVHLNEPLDDQDDKGLYTAIRVPLKLIYNLFAINSSTSINPAPLYWDSKAWDKHQGFLIVPKPDTKERDYGLKGEKRIPTSKLNLSGGKNPVRLDGVISKPRRNVHPTVKPIKLMAYLIELGCPSDGVILDPFVGSGTTCIAAKQLTRKFIGIEINPEYHALAVARVAAHPVPLDWF